MPGAVEPLAVNLIEFPRELVAARKTRPRLAEGPLREASQDEKDQLRIFEVAPESISQTVNIGATPADWSPIRLESEASDREGELMSPQIPLKTASLEDRIMAGIFDLALIVSAFAGPSSWCLLPVLRILPRKACAGRRGFGTGRLWVVVPNTVL